MKRKIVTALLTMILVLAALPMSAMAEGITTQEQLQAALNSAVDPKSVDLGGATIELTGELTIPDGVALTNGTLTADGTDRVVLGEGSSLNGININKVDKTSVDLIKINGADATIQSCNITGQYVLGDNDVVRGVVTVAGASGYNITGCNFTSLRQPGYLEGEGTVTNSSATGTRGWVVTGNHKVNFSGCTFTGNADDNTCNINIISNNGAASVYTTADLVDLSKNNPGAYVIDQNKNVALLDQVFLVATGSYNASGTTDLGKYASLTDTLTAVKDLGDTAVTVKLLNDVQVDNMVVVEKSNLTLDLNTHRLSASGNFTGSDENDKHLLQVGNDNVAVSGVKVMNGTLDTTSANKNTLNVYKATGVTISDVTLNHNGFKGAPLIVNSSTVTVEKGLTLGVGASSWYGINTGNQHGTASLTFADGASVTVTGSGADKKPAILVDGGTVTGAEKAGLVKVGESYVTTAMSTATVKNETELLAALSNSYVTTINMEGTIEVTAPVSVNRAVTIKGGTIKAASGFKRNGNEGSILSVTANDVTLDGVTVDATGVDPVKYGVHFYQVTGGKMNNCTVKNDGWTAVNVNASQVAVNGGTFDVNGSYAVFELSNGGDHKLATPTLTVTGNVAVNGVETLIWTDLEDNEDGSGNQLAEKVPTGTTANANITMNGKAMMMNGDGLLVAKPVSNPNQGGSEPEDSSAAAPAAAAATTTPVLDSTPKTGNSAVSMLPVLALGFAALGLVAKRKLQ